MDADRRRARRFPLALPIEIDSGRGITRDFSGLGVYFHTAVQLEQGAEIDFRLVVPEAVDVRCSGRITRVDRVDGAFGIAATIDSYSLSSDSVSEMEIPHIVIEALREHHGK